MVDKRFPRRWRLTRSGDFAAVYARRCSAAGSALLVYGRENGLAHARVGLGVSRRVGGAVTRNRWKRMLREAVRQAAAELPPGIDLVLVPRSGAKPELGDLRASVVRLAGRIAARLKGGAP